METLAELGEFGLIRRLAGLLDRPPDTVIKGIGDDCAVIAGRPGYCLLWTVDLLFEGRHFTADAPARAIGRKALAVSLSDIAAMGGRPRFALVTAGWPATTDPARLEEIYRGLAALAARFGVAIIGGDTNAADRLVIGTTVIGEVETGRLTLRSGARPGQLVCVSGPLGRGGDHHLRFTPRVREARRLVRRLQPTAMIDISDGPLADFTRIAEQSGVGGCLRLADLPCARGADPRAALVAGEQFELLFTLPRERAADLVPLGMTVIGETGDRAAGIRVLDEHGRPLPAVAGGYDHFGPPGGAVTAASAPESTAPFFRRRKKLYNKD